MINLLVIALRVLCVMQFVAQRKLAEAGGERQIKGLYAARRIHEGRRYNENPLRGFLV